MKTADEIKKAAACCVIGPAKHLPKCGECPYMYEKNCSDEFLKDNLAYIQQLETVVKATEQIRWERDIAIGQLKELGLSLGEKCDGKIHRWISVEERLPETRDWVLVIGVLVPEGGWFVPHIAEYFLGRWRLDDDEYSYPEDRHIKVTHWMPIPEPPAKEDEK